MSARPAVRTAPPAALRAALLAAGLAVAPFASAADDPLQVMPPAAALHPPLPGDAAPVACAGAGDAGAASAAGSVLSLADAVDRALCRNAQIRMAWGGIKIQAAALGEARAAYLPRLNGSLGRVLDKVGTSGGAGHGSAVRSTTLYAGLEWRIFDAGGRDASQAVANELLAAALASHEAAIQGALGSVVQTYFDAFAAQGALQAKLQSEAIARDTLAAAARREEQGIASRNDRLQAAAALSKAVIDKNRAQAASRKASALLAYAVGEPDAARLSLPDAIGEAPRPADVDLARWLETVKQSHPAIVAARAQLAAARNRIAAIRSEGLPTFDLSMNHYRNGRPEQSLQVATTRETTLGFKLTVPIFDGYASKYRLAGALAQAEQKDVELRDTEDQVLLEVIKAHADATSLLANLAASDNLQQAAAEALASSRRRYERGVADIFEILNAQAALADARQERVRSVSEWRSAGLRLLSTAARMGRAALTPP